MLGFLTALIVLGAIVSILLVVFGIVAARILFRYILPILIVLLIVRMIFSALLLLFNPGFWLFVIILALAIWLIGKFKK